MINNNEMKIIKKIMKKIMIIMKMKEKEMIMKENE